MDAGWRLFRMAVGTFGQETMARTTSAGWTYAQMLAHVGAWHDLTARRLRTFAETGERPEPTEDTDAFNARIATAAARRSREDLFTDLDRSYKDMRSGVEALSDEQVRQHAEDTPHGQAGWAVAVVAGNSYGHYNEHQEELQPALPASGKDLAARIDAAWKPFREGVRDLGRDGLARTTPIGWTYKDMLAHVIGWLQDIPPRLDAIRNGTNKPVGGQAAIDAYNAKSVADRKLVGPEAILDELDTSYRRMREAVTTMTKAETTDPRALLMVLARTELHWPDHEPELRR